MEGGIHKPPKIFGQFHLIEAEDQLRRLLDVLSPLESRARRMLETLKLCLAGIDCAAHIYIPQDDLDKDIFSGIALALFGEYHRPSSAISFISKEEDKSRLMDLLEKSVEWETIVVFGAIDFDWYKSRFNVFTDFFHFHILGIMQA